MANQQNYKLSENYFKQLFIGAIAAVFCMLLPAQIRATVVVRLNILELTVHSTKIIEGTVLSRKCINVPRGGICTEITMAVSETLRGKHKDTAIFIIPGGTLDGKIYLRTVGVPSFDVGESAIVFLAGTDARIVVGLSQGKFSVETSGNEKFAVQNTDGICLLDAKPSLKSDSGGPVTDWAERFTSPSVVETSMMQAGETSALEDNSKGSKLIKGGFLKVPLNIFKDTVRECNPDNYSINPSNN